MLVRVFSEANGSLRILTPGIHVDDEGARYWLSLDDSMNADPTLAGLSFIDVDTTTMPDRAKRYAWRRQGNQIVIDPAVLEAPNVVELAGASADLAASYVAAMARLAAIVTNGPTYTQAQARDAIVDMAKILQGLLRYTKGRDA